MAQSLGPAPVAATPPTARIWHPLLLIALSFFLTAPAAVVLTAVAMFRLGRRGLGIACLVAIPLLAAAFVALLVSGSTAVQLSSPWIFNLAAGIGMGWLLRWARAAAEDEGSAVGRAPWWQGVLIALGVVVVMIGLSIIGFDVYDSIRAHG